MEIRNLVAPAFLILLFGLIILAPTGTGYASRSKSVYLGEENPYLEWGCVVSVRNTRWWYDQNESIHITLVISARESITGNIASNLTGFQVVLMTPIGEFMLLNETESQRKFSQVNRTNDLGLNLELRFNRTVSLYEWKESLSEFEGVKRDCNLGFWFRIATLSEHEGQFNVVLSNFRNTGVRGWESEDFPIFIDDVENRIMSLMVWSAILLVPGLLYVANLRHNIAFLKERERLLYWVGIMGLGLYTVIFFLLGWGPVFDYVGYEWFGWYAILIVFLAGIPITLFIAGYFGLRQDRIKIAPTHLWYSTICTLLGLNYRAEAELSETWMRWKPSDYDEHYYRLALSSYAIIALGITSFAGLFGLTTFTMFIPLRIIGFFLCSGLIVMAGYTSSVYRNIRWSYRNWRQSWISFWELLFALTAPVSEVISRLHPVGKALERKEVSVSLKEFLNEELAEMGYKFHLKDQKGHETALICWFLAKVSMPRLDALPEDSDAKISMTMMLTKGFEALDSSCHHPFGYDFMLRLAAFGYYGFELASFSEEIVVDLSKIFTNKVSFDKLRMLEVVTEVSRYYESILLSREQLELDALSTFKVLQFMWSVLSALLGPPMSVVLTIYS